MRGVAGSRDRYRPVESCLASSSDAEEIARGFREKLGLSQLYLADLDAILHHRRNLPVYRRLADEGFALYVDAGLREAGAAADILNSGASAVVAGLETIAGPESLRTLCRDYGRERVIFSLDLKAGVPMGNTTAWGGGEPMQLVEWAVDCGAGRLIVLDLAQVGTEQGLVTLPLCRDVRATYPDVELITGGGVRGVADLDLLAAAAIDGVLVASALHDGRIHRKHIERFRHKT